MSGRFSNNIGKSNKIITLTILLNLFIGNILLLPIGGDKFGYSKILFHVIVSIIAVKFLRLLFAKITVDIKKYKLVLFPIIVSWLIPLLSIYFGFFLMGIINGELKSIIVGVPFALIGSIAFWFLWLPLSIINVVFTFLYFKLLVQRDNE